MLGLLMIVLSANNNLFLLCLCISVHPSLQSVYFNVMHCLLLGKMSKNVVLFFFVFSAPAASLMPLIRISY